ncbi:hypothetical protein SASPL_152441 [Salvia splendens]|uniref:Peptidase metallopeptidase domain-containing protein n=1 Tax=Salvia splendens TaxID=180675 RepID=A0A8X8Z0X7_SALSN|nr:hypothetical protein SASPL_152441 [Salvia splendens]
MVLHPIFIFLIFILLAPLGHASTPSDKNSSPFDFLKKLKGSHKGNNTKEIHKLKAYLEQFGYLKYENETHATDDDFDDNLESAIKTYQKNYRIKSSAPVQRAFQTWKNFTHFTFAQVQTNRNSDLLIAFYRGAHGDYESFDAFRPLAHAFAPTNGSFHYNADIRWSIGAVEDYFDLETVALHEIGHLLGLGHSSDDAAIMYPTIYSGVIKNLHEDDIQGIRALYNR